MTSTLHLVVKRRVRAPVERVFAAWTTAEALRQWWGPEGVACADVELDARVGGRYRIENAMPDGRTLIIAGTFDRIDAPRELAFSWRVDDGPEERVTVRFEAKGAETEVVVVHEKIADDDARKSHASGWEGCLQGLDAFVADESSFKRPTKST